ncbi:hypothetical protein V6Z11_A04G032700 [Gossypium hirsutum]
MFHYMQIYLSIVTLFSICIMHHVSCTSPICGPTKNPLTLNLISKQTQKLILTLNPLGPKQCDPNHNKNSNISNPRCAAPRVF